jgi:antibiotic biosynthesis monooxygenase
VRLAAARIRCTRARCAGSPAWLVQTRTSSSSSRSSPHQSIATTCRGFSAERDRYVDAHRELVSRARAFDGCIDLSISADTVDPRRINNFEAWRDSEVLDSWWGQANVPDHGIEPRGGAMKRYDATDGGPLF